ncbi:hypothetical protein [Micromonospora sp. RV43]|uniref:hypothetical protein n=1 Tax=Micromonospora sp. RV43 TaxID=1661387 RepID=UPI00064C126C|nr:hypothetical protein [Micromonospora sp. RV43]
MSKQLPASRGVDDLLGVLRQRHQPAAPASAAVRPATPAAVEMDRRSWYMRRDVADSLARALDDLHYATRAPKHVILAAIVEHALADLDGIRDRLPDPPA